MGRKSLKLQTPIVIYGKLNVFNGKKSISHPEISAPLANEVSSTLEASVLHNR